MGETIKWFQVRSGGVFPGKNREFGGAMGLRMWFGVAAGCLFTGVACVNEGDDSVDDPADDPTVGFLETCDVPDDLDTDPLWETGSAGAEGTVHIVDVVRDPVSGRVYGTGAGGLMTFAESGGEVSLLGQLKGGGTNGTNLEVLGGDLLALSHKRGFRVLDMSEPTELTTVGGGNIGQSSGLAWDGSNLFVLTMSGELKVYTSVEMGMSPAASLSGFESPSEIVLVGEYGYVADNLAGVLVVDLSTPTAPSIVTTVQGGGGAQDIATDGSYLYLASGSVGIEVFSLADPEAPEQVATVSYGSSVVAVDVADGLLWATNHEDLIVLDVADPEVPVPLAMEQTEEWALNVVGVGNTAFVGDWTRMRHFELEAGSDTAEADPSVSDLYFYEGSVVRTLEISNRGGGELELRGYGLADTRFSVSFDRAVVGPGEHAVVTLEFEDDGEPVDTTLCLVTNDPDEPVQQIGLASTSSSSAIVIGEDAKDFTLVDLDGQTHTLSDQIGHPVVLVYFATW